MTAEVVPLSVNTPEQRKADWLEIHTIAARIERTTRDADERAVARTVREMASERLRVLESGK